MHDYDKPVITSTGKRAPTWEDSTSYDLSSIPDIGVVEDLPQPDAIVPIWEVDHEPTL